MRCVGSSITAALFATVLMVAPDRARADDGWTANAVRVEDSDDDPDDDDLEPNREAGDALGPAADAMNMAGGWTWPAGSKPLAGEMSGDWPARLLLFSSTDLWSHGAFGHSGLLWAPAWLDREGLVLKLIFGGGTYRYLSGALGDAQVMGRQLSAAILPGMRFVRGGVTAAVFAGLEFQDHRLQPNDPGASLRGSYLGLRFGFDLWYQPTELLMITADASLSTIAASYSARLAGGVRLFDLFYLGPEVQSFAGGNYRQYRFGAHATGLRIGNAEWSVGLGWARDSDARTGVYGKLGMLTRH